MGTFGVYVFDDDMACDALAAIVNAATPWHDIQSGIVDVIGSEFIDADEAQPLLVYCILLVCLIDRDNLERRASEEIGIPYRESVTKFLEEHQAEWDSEWASKPIGGKTLVQLALEGLAAIKKPGISELYDLWAESEYLGSWLQVVQGIEADLSK